MRPFEPVYQQLFLNLVSSLSSIFVIRSILSHIYCLGKSKNNIKKTKQTFTFKQRFMLCHIKKDEKKYYPKHTAFFYRLFPIYLIIITISLFAVILAIIMPQLRIISYYILIGKCVVFDIPFLAFFVLKTEMDRVHGGVKWKYDKY